MNAITIVVIATESSPPVHLDPAERLRDELRARGITCVLLVQSNGANTAVVLACNALAGASISAVVVADLVFSSALVEDLSRTLPRVLMAQPSTSATLDDLEARGWIPGPSDSYTEEELRRVTARLQDLGYA